jgi:hypothetical protein
VNFSPPLSSLPDVPIVGLAHIRRCFRSSKMGCIDRTAQAGATFGVDSSIRFLSILYFWSIFDVNYLSSIHSFNSPSKDEKAARDLRKRVSGFSELSTFSALLFSSMRSVTHPSRHSSPARRKVAVNPVMLAMTAPIVPVAAVPMPVEVE